MEQFWRIGDFAKKVGKHSNTVDGWFKQLEEKRIHYINRAGNEKVYDDTDLAIAVFIRDRRDGKPAWALEAIFQTLPEQFELRPFPDGVEATSDSQVLDIEAIKASLRAEFQAMTDQVAAAVAVVHALPDPEQQRRERLNDHITGKRIERQLRREALELWKEKPEAERMIKTGWFRKEEDTTARDQFILDYLDEHYESRMNEEYGL